MIRFQKELIKTATCKNIKENPFKALDLEHFTIYKKENNHCVHVVLLSQRTLL